MARVERSLSFVVANPALSLHDRTERFEQRANASPIRPGVGRRLTARLYPIAWTRGYAQYGGAPIANILANRHVEFATNDALLAEQQAVFGTSDPDGRRGVAAAGRRVAAADLLAGAGADERWTEAVLELERGGEGDVGVDPPSEPWRDTPTDATVNVSVDAAADRAYAALVGIETDTPGGDSKRERERDVARIAERVHTVEARFDVERERRRVSSWSDGQPGPDWRLADERRTERVEIAAADGRLPTADGWSTRDGDVFDATVTETTTREWRRGNETRTTESVVERTILVRVAVQARTLPVAGALNGNLDGALSGATDRATERAVRKAGGLRGAAQTVAVGKDPPRATATVEPTVPQDDIEVDLREVRERTRNLSVSVPAPAVGAGRANPPERLRKLLSDRRDELRGEGGTSASERTRLAVRTAYLEELDARLEARAAAHRETNAGVQGAVREHLDADRLDGALASHREAKRPESKPLSDPAGNLSLSVETEPAYLPTSEVSRGRLAVHGGGTVHPLAARNVNVFTSPHGQVAKSIVDRIPFLGTERVSLATAAAALAAADDAPDAEKQALQREVAAANAHVRGELRAAMVAEGVSERTAREALETDASTAEEARGLANGTAVDRVVGSVDAEAPERDRLRVRLETTLDDALRDERARPPRDSTNSAAERTRKAARDELKGAIADGVETGSERARRWALGRRLGSIPAGLPIAPVPGHWYATGNVWVVDVGGTYERFAVRSNRGGPTGATTYVRDGRITGLDHDGERRRLGTAERVSFRTRTAVVVVVPAGGSGVGDTGGEMDERSAGWPP